MNRRLSVMTRRTGIALFVCCLGAIGPVLRAEVSPLSPSATPVLGPNGLPVPAAVPVAKPTTNPTLPRPKPMDADTKKAAALTAAQSQIIDTYIKTSVTRFMSDDPSGIETGRADLIAGTSDPAPKQPCSAPYLTQYMATFVTQMQPIVGKAALPKRVNAAIVIARIAENINNGGNGVSMLPLHPFIIAELNDKCDAVTLWGMKAAKDVLIAAPGVPGQGVLNNIVPCVINHGLSGPITEEAYGALDSSTPDAIRETIKLYQTRVAAYANNAMPPEPNVDRRAASHLTSGSGMWGKMSKAQKTQAMDLIRQNLVGASNALAAAGAAPTPEGVAQLRILIVDDCKAVYVVAALEGLTNLMLPAKQGTAIGDNASPPEIVARAAAVIAELQQAFPTTNAGGAGAASPAAVAKP